LFKQKFVWDYDDNAGSPLKVAGHKGHVRVSDGDALRLNCLSKRRIARQLEDCQLQWLLPLNGLFGQKVLRLEAGGHRGQPERVWISA
jgi:hypothetical protein